MDFRVQITPKELRGEINISGSKSESNRLLILQALHPEVQIKNLSDAQDTQVLQTALKSKSNKINIGHAGTAMRFLTAFFATQNNREVVLKGSERMHQRPIQPLVDALQKLGADIQCLGEEGFPPLRIKGKKIVGNAIEMEAHISSQFITAILLIATKFDSVFTISLNGKITSRPYILMTLSLIEQLGIKTSFEGNNITIYPARVRSTRFAVEPDWSSASYFYSIVALSESAKITLPNFQKESLQGDARLVEIYEQFGVKTTFGETGIRLEKASKDLPQKIKLNLNQTPDLAQTIAVTCLGLGVECQLTGLETLVAKETNRLVALKAEIEKFGAKVLIDKESLILTPIPRKLKEDVTIKTYEDHRMAMAFAPLALRTSLTIQNVKVVQKSFPKFWEALQKLNFELIPVS
ncbi:3-phosphoshikimate 1-carboxyvinyltransferase [Mesonia sp. K7]|uniref:3-phosphoshikimate 1-carboxyvinyltransferase n=1 Tax=Mesonia sp. K7 TaxID=2218606 RepID=UPI000DA73EF6|nr:3-phosphoshikimate 1-carboxyvinyltransferase [Mesonia sp. K7]PZD77704.1 3-phosphoshikimate 1-carboxyvinyltransferase [Mesonia sp. K7]